MLRRYPSSALRKWGTRFRWRAAAWLFAAEDSGEKLEVGFGDDDLTAFDGRLQGDWVAAAGLTHGTGDQG